MSLRVVSLRFQNGHPVCAPIFVSLEGRNYQPTDIEFEEEACARQCVTGWSEIALKSSPSSAGDGTMKRR